MLVRRFFLISSETAARPIAPLRDNPGVQIDRGRALPSGIAQALLGEPGTAHKAFALLRFWCLNGFALDRDLFGSIE